MIALLDQRDPRIAEQIYHLQQASYAVERDLIEYLDFPPLAVTAQEIQAEPDTFLGYWEDGYLAGVLSFTLTPALLDIGRLIVHPLYFRRGIAGQLLQMVENYAKAPIRITVSTAEKNLPAVRLYQKHGYHLTERTVLPDGLVLVRFFKSVCG
ncbi:MAG: GNAT family N-acetyltransferase [Caldilinea sp. CFX5]|nr:GNAT family N-acetyltransferase [Caldilinea sp. CFX5]